MKAIQKTLIIGVILFIPFLKIFAQEDSVIVEKTTESVENSDFKKKRDYMYLDNNFREERTLLKVGYSPLSTLALNSEADFLGEFKGNIDFEHKLNPSLSVIIGNYLSYQKNGSYFNGLTFNNSIGIRYYYLIKRNIKKSLGANNFHSNYFSIKLDEFIKYDYSESWAYSVSYNPYSYTSYHSKEEMWSLDPYICLSWGIQRRIGKWWYIDVAPYFKFNKNSYGFGILLQIGFAWGK